MSKCGTPFSPKTGRQRYCSVGCRPGSAASSNGASSRKTRENAKIDAMLDTPIATAPRAKKKPQKLRELPARRTRQPAPAPSPNSPTPTLEDAQQVLEISGFEVLGLVRTPAGAVLSIRLGGAR